MLALFDRFNLSGRYCLDLSRPVDRALAGRLQLAALQRCSGSIASSQHAWRNVWLDGEEVEKQALGQLQLYAIPTRGQLCLDFMEQQVHMPWAAPTGCHCERAVLVDGAAANTASRATGPMPAA